MYFMEIIMPRYLYKRRRRWYAVLDIPKAVRPKFGGKPRLVQSLETESLTVAERRVLEVVARWKHQIAAVASGNNSLEAAVAGWRANVDQHRRDGWTEAEIDEVSLDVATTLWEESPDLGIAHSIVRGDWVLLSEHVSSYRASLQNEPKTIDMKVRDVRQFVQQFKYAHDVTKQRLIEWVENKLIGEDRLSPPTCRRMISACRNYWEYLERHRGLKLDAPFKGVVPSANTKKSKLELRAKRKHFSVDDYKKLLSAVPAHDDALRDLIRLAAHTGARIEELCSLKLEQVLDDRFKIEDAKTEAGWRIIPIHDDIKQLVARLKDESTDGYLISGLTFNQYQDRSNAIGKRFGRLKTSLGYGNDYVFHSFRKGLARQLEAHGVPENVSARLLGHEISTMTYGLYSGGLPFEVLHEAIMKVSFR